MIDQKYLVPSILRGGGTDPVSIPPLCMRIRSAVGVTPRTGAKSVSDSSLSSDNSEGIGFFDMWCSQTCIGLRQP